MDTKVLAFAVRRRILGDPCLLSVPHYRELHLKDAVVFIDLDQEGNIRSARLFMHERSLLQPGWAKPDAYWVADGAMPETGTAVYRR